MSEEINTVLRLVAGGQLTPEVRSAVHAEAIHDVDPGPGSIRNITDIVDEACRLRMCRLTGCMLSGARRDGSQTRTSGV